MTDGHKTPLPVTGIWLRGNGKDLDVLVEVAGDWYVCISESIFNPETISHIAETRGISKWPKYERPKDGAE